MTDITRSVGAGGENLRHDVIIVQLMLKKVKNQSERSYFGGGYTAAYGGDTAQAIMSFQTDQKLVGTKPGIVPGPGGGEIPGLIKPGGRTWLALREAFSTVDEQYRMARSHKGIPVAYLAMSTSVRAQAENSVRSAPNLQPDFRQKVVQC